MWVNPFWFGILVTIVAEIIVLCICGFVMMRGKEKDGKTGTEARRD